MTNRHVTLQDHTNGKDILAADPARNTYVLDDGVLVECNESFAGRTDRISRLLAAGTTPELRTRGAGCAPDPVDHSVRVRFTQPRKARA